jgi:hypothetical protein
MECDFLIGHTALPLDDVDPFNRSRIETDEIAFADLIAQQPADESDVEPWRRDGHGGILVKPTIVPHLIALHFHWERPSL